VSAAGFSLGARVRCFVSSGITQVVSGTTGSGKGLLKVELREMPLN